MQRIHYNKRGWPYLHVWEMGAFAGRSMLISAQEFALQDRTHQVLVHFAHVYKQLPTHLQTHIASESLLQMYWRVTVWVSGCWNQTALLACCSEPGVEIPARLPGVLLWIQEIKVKTSPLGPALCFNTHRLADKKMWMLWEETVIKQH